MKVVPVVVWLAVLLLPATASAHAQKATTEPEVGSKVEAPVDHLIINLTETPVEDATSIEVVDGCDRVLATDLFTEQKTIHVNVNDPGQPGRWKVSYDTLSAEDGHTSSERFSFRVTGKKDCSEPSESPQPDESPPSGTEGDGSGGDNEDEGGSFPVVPVAAATVAVLGIALLARGGSKS